VRAFQTANRRRPGLRPVIAGAMLLLAAAGWAQNVLIPDLRDPALYRDPARTASCRVCGEVTSIREVRVDPSIPGALDPGRNPIKSTQGQLVAGAVILVPFGPGGEERPYVGGIGTQEMAERMGTSSYEIAIRMDTGERRVVQRRDGGSYYIGQRVTLSGGMMAPL